MSDLAAIAASLSFGQSVGSGRSCGRAQRPPASSRRWFSPRQNHLRVQSSAHGLEVKGAVVAWHDKQPDGRARRIISSPALRFSPGRVSTLSAASGRSEDVWRRGFYLGEISQD